MPETRILPARCPIAIVDPLGKHGGHHYYVRALATALAGQGAPVLVHVTEQTGVDGREPYPAVVSFGRLYGSDPAALRGLRYLRGMIGALLACRLRGANRLNLHIFSFGILDALSVWGARLLGMKPILTVHDVECFGNKENGLCRAAILRGASGFIVHNEHCRAAFNAAAPACRKPLAVIPHGHYRDSFELIPDRAQARARLDVDANDTLILFFGNSRLEKGLDLLIEACGQMGDIPGWRLIIAGKMKEPQERMYRELIARHAPQAPIQMFVGHISDEDAVAFYRAANLVVIPYKKIYESGVSIMAMSLARAVLASDLPPLAASLQQGRAGMLFRSGDSADLARQLRTALGRADLDELGETARQTVGVTRDWNAIARSFLQFSDSL